MKRVASLLCAVAIAARVVAAAAQTPTRADGKSASQSAKEIRGATPYLEIKNEPPARLIEAVHSH